LLNGYSFNTLLPGDNFQDSVTIARNGEDITIRGAKNDAKLLDTGTSTCLVMPGFCQDNACIARIWQLADLSPAWLVYVVGSGGSESLGGHPLALVVYGLVTFARWLPLDITLIVIMVVM
jgi:hypothetical protein